MCVSILSSLVIVKPYDIGAKRLYREKPHFFQKQLYLLTLTNLFTETHTHTKHHPECDDSNEEPLVKRPSKYDIMSLSTKLIQMLGVGRQQFRLFYN